MTTAFGQEPSTSRPLLEGLVANIYSKLKEDKRTSHLLRHVHKERYCWQQVAWLEHRFPVSGSDSALVIRQAYQQLLDSMKLKPSVSSAFLEHVDNSLQAACI